MIEEASRICRIVNEASVFPWTWSGDDVDRFCNIVGWRVTDRTPNYVRIATDFEIQNPTGDVRIEGGRVAYLRCVASDKLSHPDSNSSALDKATYSELVDAISGVLNVDPTIGVGYAVTARWDLSEVLVKVSYTRMHVVVSLINPAYQKEQDWITENVVPVLEEGVSED